MAQLMPLPLAVSCFSKIQIGFTFLVPAYPGSPGKRAVKRVCVLGLTPCCGTVITHCAYVVCYFRDVCPFIYFIIAMYVHHLGLYCILFRRFLISKINVALQLTKLLLKKVTTTMIHIGGAGVINFQLTDRMIANSNSRHGFILGLILLLTNYLTNSS